MKIRTDFVTNSSSSSFVTVTVETFDDQLFTLFECEEDFVWREQNMPEITEAGPHIQTWSRNENKYILHKGNPIGQAMMIVFSLLYGMISYRFSYYGEMATYLGMTGPMALFALISWLRNPYKGNKAEVAVNRLGAAEWMFLLLLTSVVAVVFYFILDYFGTANMFFSTLSVTTSFIAVYLTFRRSPYFALAYAANDIVLIVLWILAAIEDISYLSVMICFVLFLVNDIYGYISWRKMERRQMA